MSEPFIVIELPLPSDKLSPNARTHWAAKARAAKKSRHDATIMAKQAVHPTCPWNAATIQYSFTFRDKRKRDDDNLAIMCKNYRDAVADVGIVADDHDLKMMPVEILPPDSKHPGLKITITRIS